MPSLLIITQSDHDPASRFRAMQYLPYFRSAGWEVTHHVYSPTLYRKKWFSSGPLSQLENILTNLYRRAKSFPIFYHADRYDIVIVSREIPCLQKLLVARARHLIVDVDDDICTGSQAPSIVELFKSATMIVAGNGILAQKIRIHNPATIIIPTVVDVQSYTTPSSDFSSGSFRIGWLGSPYSVKETLGPVMNMLAELQNRYNFEFVIVSSQPEAVPQSRLQWRFISWSPSVETKIAELFDVGIMPLQDIPTHRSKCGCKLLQYMAAGLPAIASPIGINREIMEHGVTGLYATTATEWAEAIGALMGDRALCREMGSVARERVSQAYSCDHGASLWLKVLNDVIKSR